MSTSEKITDKTTKKAVVETNSVKKTEEKHGDPVLELNGVTRNFEGEIAVENLSFSVYEGEILTLLGPSGCGKTTILRLIAGLEKTDSGTISIRGDIVSSDNKFVQPDNRDIGLIFQDFALFPHLSVRENIAYGIQDMDKDEIDQRIEELLNLVDLSGYKDHSTDTLSGGQQQRVALARSLAPKPDVLLLDEPFSNLDVGLRKKMREEVRRILKATGVTAISVTHDQEEALSISDRVAVINNGCLEQIGSPEYVFQNPESKFVAEFLGEAGFIPGHIEDSSVKTPIGSFNTDILEKGGPKKTDMNIDILVRPDDVYARVADDCKANGHITYRQYTGPSFVYRVELGSGDIVYCEHNHVDKFNLYQKVRVDLVADHRLAWFPSD